MYGNFQNKYNKFQNISSLFVIYVAMLKLLVFLYFFKFMYDKQCVPKLKKLKCNAIFIMCYYYGNKNISKFYGIFYFYECFELKF